MPTSRSPTVRASQLTSLNIGEGDAGSLEEPGPVHESQLVNRQTDTIDNITIWLRFTIHT